MRRAEARVHWHVVPAGGLRERPAIEQFGAHEHDANVRERRANPRGP